MISSGSFAVLSALRRSIRAVGPFEKRAIGNRFATRKASEEPINQTGGLPEVTKEIEQECNTNVPEEEMRARKTASIMNWLESRYGRERVALAKILQEHQVVVRGSREDGLKLLEALLEWKQREL